MTLYEENFHEEKSLHTFYTSSPTKRSPTPPEPVNQLDIKWRKRRPSPDRDFSLSSDEDAYMRKKERRHRNHRRDGEPGRKRKQRNKIQKKSHKYVHDGTTSENTSFSPTKPFPISSPNCIKISRPTLLPAPVEPRAHVDYWDEEEEEARRRRSRYREDENGNGERKQRNKMQKKSHKYVRDGTTSENTSFSPIRPFPISSPNCKKISRPTLLPAPVEPRAHVDYWDEEEEETRRRRSRYREDENGNGERKQRKKFQNRPQKFLRKRKAPEMSRSSISAPNRNRISRPSLLPAPTSLEEHIEKLVGSCRIEKNPLKQASLIVEILGMYKILGNAFESIKSEFHQKIKSSDPRFWGYDTAFGDNFEDLWSYGLLHFCKSWSTDDKDVVKQLIELKLGNNIFELDAEDRCGNAFQVIGAFCSPSSIRALQHILFQVSTPEQFDEYVGQTQSCNARVIYFKGRYYIAIHGQSIPLSVGGLPDAITFYVIVHFYFGLRFPEKCREILYAVTVLMGLPLPAKTQLSQRLTDLISGAFEMIQQNRKKFGERKLAKFNWTPTLMHNSAPVNNAHSSTTPLPLSISLTSALEKLPKAFNSAINNNASSQQSSMSHSPAATAVFMSGDTTSDAVMAGSAASNVVGTNCQTVTKELSFEPSKPTNIQQDLRHIKIEFKG